MRVSIHNSDARAYITKLLWMIDIHAWGNGSSFIEETRRFSADLQDRLEEESFHLASHLPTFGYISFGNMDSWLN